MLRHTPACLNDRSTNGWRGNSSRQQGRATAAAATATPYYSAPSTSSTTSGPGALAGSTASAAGLTWQMQTIKRTRKNKHFGIFANRKYVSWRMRDPRTVQLPDMKSCRLLLCRRRLTPCHMWRRVSSPYPDYRLLCSHASGRDVRHLMG